jgi:hypothetical protein
MSDLELTEHESDRLRELLHRRADRIQVSTPQFDVVSPTHEAPRRGNGRWFAAAAVVLVLAAVGGAWWLSSDGTDRIDSLPAEPTVTVAPQVLEETGIWRLPEGLDGYQVVGAQDGGSSDSSSLDAHGVIAVDDADDPQRALLLQQYDELGEIPADTRTATWSGEVEAAFVSTADSTWFRVAPAGAPSGELTVSGSAIGIDDTELTELLRTNLGTLDALRTVSDGTATMEAVLDGAGFGDDRIVWQGNGDGAPGSSNQQLQVSLMSDDGTEVVILLNGADAPAWDRAIQMRMTADLVSWRSRGTSAGELIVRPRVDLGRHALEVIDQLPGVEPTSYLVVHSDDGTSISAVTARAVGTATEEPIATLSEEQQLRIINSLRAMSEDEFLARLSELGA